MGSGAGGEEQEGGGYAPPYRGHGQQYLNISIEFLLHFPSIIVKVYQRGAWISIFN